jgi:predicted nuclease of predicted toxin-antitoxin system
VTAPDSVIFDRAVADGYVVVTADTDFSMLLALRRAPLPSVILLRRVSELSPDDHGRLLLANLPAIVEDLHRGVVVSLSPTRLAIRTCRSAEHVGDADPRPLAPRSVPQMATPTAI